MSRGRYIRTPWGRLFRRDHVLVMGLPGCGKTPYALELVAEAARVVFADLAGEADPSRWRIVTVDQLEANPSLLAGTFLRLAVRFEDEENPGPEFVRLVLVLRAAAPHGGLVFVVDEVGDIAEDAKGAAQLRGLHRNGHKDGIATVLASPVWTDFPRRCRTTATRVFCFRQEDAEDIRLLNQRFARTAIPDFGDRAAAWQYPAPPVAWVSPTLHA